MYTPKAGDFSDSLTRYTWQRSRHLILISILVKYWRIPSAPVRYLNLFHKATWQRLIYPVGPDYPQPVIYIVVHHDIP